MAAAPLLSPQTASYPFAAMSRFPAQAHLGALARRRPLRATDEGDDEDPVVLVVEPDERTRSLLQAGLRREGFAVIAAASGEEALRFLAPDRPLPGMIFCEADLRNRGGDGFSLCGQVRAEQRTADLPVVLLAHSPESYHRELAGGAGADQYLPKPLFLKDVVALARLMAGRSASAARFSADTERLPLPQLLRALLSGVRAGRIELEPQRAFITFREGRVVDAGCDGLRGEDALTRILLLASGPYLVTFGPALTRATMTFGLRDLCRRMLPRVARWQTLLGRGVPLKALLVVDFARLKGALDGLPDEVHGVLRLFDGRRTVREVVLDASLDEVTALEVVTRLYALSLITLKESPASAPAGAPPAFFEPAPPSPERTLERTGPLEPELLRQLDAFRIKPVIDRPLKRLIDPPTPELVQFNRGPAPEEPAPVVLVEAPALDEDAAAPVKHAADSSLPDAAASVEHSAASVEHSAASVEHSAASVEHSAAPVEHFAASVQYAATPVRHAAAPVQQAAAPVQGAAAQVQHVASPREDAAADPVKHVAAAPMQHAAAPMQDAAASVEHAAASPLELGAPSPMEDEFFRRGEEPAAPAPATEAPVGAAVSARQGRSPRRLALPVVLAALVIAGLVIAAGIASALR